VNTLFVPNTPPTLSFTLSGGSIIVESGTDWQNGVIYMQSTSLDTLINMAGSSDSDGTVVQYRVLASGNIELYKWSNSQYTLPGSYSSNNGKFGTIETFTLEITDDKWATNTKTFQIDWQ
jgi:hypothetical protein